MRIALVGEFSRLHNSLKEGLVVLGHDVVLFNNGDGFKNYPSDYSSCAVWCESKLGNIPRQIIYRITKFDISKIERGIRFYFHLNKLKNFDVVQLINEAPIQTINWLERFLLKKIFKQNTDVFLLCSGVDYFSVQHMLSKKERYSIMNPHFEKIKEAQKEVDFLMSYVTVSSYKTHQLVIKNCKGLIASDLDYVNPIKGHTKFVGLVPNPINTNRIKYSKNIIKDKINIFLGINSGNYYLKGINHFEMALSLIKEKYPDKINIIITRDIPYSSYIKYYDNAHILLDQVYGYDQGYNALEAMAKGKVVFTGADKEFLDYYNLKDDEVAINALPDVGYLVSKLSFLIENPSEIDKIGQNAYEFVRSEHDYIKIAEKYLGKWSLN